MKVILFGAGGAMGKKVAALQATRQNFEIVASVSQEFISDEEKNLHLNALEKSLSEVNPDDTLTIKGIKKYSIDHYGENCGLVLQYMFNAKRNKKFSFSYPTSTNFLQYFMYNLYKKYKGGNNICLQNTMKIKGYLR